MAQVIAEVQVTSDDEDVTLVVRKIQNQSLMERKSQRNIQQVAEEKQHITRDIGQQNTAVTENMKGRTEREKRGRQEETTDVRK